MSLAADRASVTAGDTLTYTLLLKNMGPSTATGITITDRIPAGLLPISNLPSQGAYSAATGEWTVGTLAPGSASLQIRTRVAAGTAGVSLLDTATVSASGQTDPIASNDVSRVGVRVRAADLHLVMTVDRTSMLAADSVRFTLIVRNAGPDTAAVVVVRSLLPAGLLFRSSRSGQGSYVAATGDWSVGQLVSGASASLDIVARLAAATGTGPITHKGWTASRDPEDPTEANNRDSVTVIAIVPTADLAVFIYPSNSAPGAGNAIPADFMPPKNGDTLYFVVRITNNGPDAASGVKVSALVPAQPRRTASCSSRRPRRQWSR